MLDYFSFRYRRILRRIRRRILIVRRATSRYIEHHITSRWYHLRFVKKVVSIWALILIVGVSASTAQIFALERIGRVAVAIPGGTYTEAAVGNVTVLNPVLPDADSADINKLIYSGLTRYNLEGKLVGDLATSWEISSDGKTYTFHLRPDVKWHDGVPFGSADVAFTLEAIQNPDSRSPLASSWQGVSVETQDDSTVIFKLPSRLTSFIDSTTLGIIPRHLLELTEPSQLRDAGFNQEPIGTGPFKMENFAPAANEITLKANPDYYGGKPKLNEFSYRYYDTHEAAVDAYRARQVLSPGRISEGSTEADFGKNLQSYDYSLPEEGTVFFNLGDTTLNSVELRRILAASINRDTLVSNALDDEAQSQSQPLLPGQPGFSTKYAPEALTPEAANASLESLGWAKVDGQAVRKKGNKSLDLKITTLSGGALERSARELKVQWSKLGINVTINARPLADLQQTYMRPRNFQILLYGINLGADPDVYAYWHSSQAKDPGVNLSGYSSTAADRALEAGRVNSDEQIRTGKYDTFLKAWNQDVPGIVLYQEKYQYAADSRVRGILGGRLITPVDRYFDVTKWTINERYDPRYP